MYGKIYNDIKKKKISKKLPWYVYNVKGKDKVLLVLLPSEKVTSNYLTRFVWRLNFNGTL